jgi:hypothetical protein
MRRLFKSAVHALLTMAALSCCSSCSSSGSGREAKGQDGGSPDLVAAADAALEDMAIREDVAADVATDLGQDAGMDGVGLDDGVAPDAGAVGACDPDEITSQWKETVPFGYVSVASDYAIGLGGYEEESATYSASFYDSHPSPCDFQVVTLQCVLQQCSIVTAPRQAQAGLIAFRVSGVQEYLLSDNATAHMYQSVYTSSGAWRTGGLPLQIEDRALNPTTGTGYIPHFIADLTTPARILLTEPVLSADVDLNTRTPYTLVRAQGMDLRWTGGTCPGSVRVTVNIQTSTTRYHATCRFDPAAGTAHVPSEVLTLLPSGSGSMTFETAVEQIVEIEGWRIRAAGTTAAVMPSNKEPYSEIGLQ